MSREPNIYEDTAAIVPLDDVRWLDIAVHDLPLPERVYRRPYFAPDLHQLIWCECCCVGVEVSSKVTATMQLVRDESKALSIDRERLGPYKLDDPRTVKRGEKLDLAIYTPMIGIRPEDLDCSRCAAGSPLQHRTLTAFTKWTLYINILG